GSLRSAPTRVRRPSYPACRSASTARSPASDAPTTTTRRSKSARSVLGLVKTLGQRVPGQGRALDSHGELHHALQGLEVAERHAGLGRDGLVDGLPVAVEALLVDRHERLEGADERASLVDALALHGRRHHRRRRLADRTALAVDAHVVDAVAVDVEVDD